MRSGAITGQRHQYRGRESGEVDSDVVAAQALHAGDATRQKCSLAPRWLKSASTTGKPHRTDLLHVPMTHCHFQATLDRCEYIIARALQCSSPCKIERYLGSCALREQSATAQYKLTKSLWSAIRRRGHRGARAKIEAFEPKYPIFTCPWSRTAHHGLVQRPEKR
ncbi:uncharacterized protein K489DRAFT_48007 [Dissoconium aciculare CBS 342.82]|uniref:Uncharacterized protein n=1 Tax=Dissoconium aciculare CBS 342.82 TaxID=1314786 RepID=A0A6J3LXZ4_9PEZI|nr:uncharacterized protein K489DRAFT_48007 [Dissoconium aciculare CBS 342.82]KAF1820159.1 hypothetical protein K489DRAFT_48007 [Dissoconium aciculare CBS 342.82]